MRKCLLHGRKGINAVQDVFNRGRCKETEYSRLKVFKIGYLLGPSDEACAFPKSNTWEYWKSFLVMYQSFPKPPIPPGIPRGFAPYSGEFEKSEAHPLGHLTFVSKRWSASQAKEFCYGFRIQHDCAPRSRPGHSSYIYIFTVLLKHFVNLSKSQLNVSFLKWTILLKWTNLRTTAFGDFR